MMLFRTGCRALGKTGTTGKQPRGETATRQIYIYVYVKVILYYRALVRWCAGALVRWCAGALVRWCAGALVRWCAGALVRWCAGALVRCLPDGKLRVV
jgi:hypothetical protein